MPDRKRFDVLMVLNYYTPYVSGLTEVARVVAEGLVRRGRRVAVATSRHQPELASHELVNGVEVFRAPVLAKYGRGVISPAFPLQVARLARDARVVNLHLPMIEAGVIARSLRSTPIVSTYHIDVWIPRSPTSPLQIKAVDASARSALRRSAAVVVNSEDQARHSRLWETVRAQPWRPIPAPCLDRDGGAPRFRETDGYHVGFLGRIVEDKGIEYLVQAFRAIDDPAARLLLGGDYTGVAGGGIVDRIRAAAAGDGRIRILGLLRGREIEDLYASIDAFALPSVAESFGIVQVEAMMTGVPVVSTDLPGGRYPVMATGFGRLVAPRAPAEITRALLELRAVPAAQRAAGRERARRLFGVESCLDAYAVLFDDVAGPDRGRSPARQYA